MTDTGGKQGPICFPIRPRGTRTTLSPIHESNDTIPVKDDARNRAVAMPYYVYKNSTHLRKILDNVDVKQPVLLFHKCNQVEHFPDFFKELGFAPVPNGNSAIGLYPIQLILTHLNYPKSQLKPNRKNAVESWNKRFKNQDVSGSTGDIDDSLVVSSVLHVFMLHTLACAMNANIYIVWTCNMKDESNRSQTCTMSVKLGEENAKFDIILFTRDNSKENALGNKMMVFQIVAPIAEKNAISLSAQQAKGRNVFRTLELQDGQNVMFVMTQLLPQCNCESVTVEENSRVRFPELEVDTEKSKLVVKIPEELHNYHSIEVLMKMFLVKEKNTKKEDPYKGVRLPDTKFGFISESDSRKYAVFVRVQQQKKGTNTGIIQNQPYKLVNFDQDWVESARKKVSKLLTTDEVAESPFLIMVSQYSVFYNMCNRILIQKKSERDLEQLEQNAKKGKIWRFPYKDPASPNCYRMHHMVGPTIKASDEEKHLNATKSDSDFAFIWDTLEQGGSSTAQLASFACTYLKKILDEMRKVRPGTLAIEIPIIDSAMNQLCTVCHAELLMNKEMGAMHLGDVKNLHELEARLLDENFLIEDRVINEANERGLVHPIPVKALKDQIKKLTVLPPCECYISSANLDRLRCGKCDVVLTQDNNGLTTYEFHEINGTVISETCQYIVKTKHKLVYSFVCSEYMVFVVNIPGMIHIYKTEPHSCILDILTPVCIMKGEVESATLNIHHQRVICSVSIEGRRELRAFSINGEITTLTGQEPIKVKRMYNMSTRYFAVVTEQGTSVWRIREDGISREKTEMWRLMNTPWVNQLCRSKNTRAFCDENSVRLLKEDDQNDWHVRIEKAKEIADEEIRPDEEIILDIRKSDSLFLSDINITRIIDPESLRVTRNVLEGILVRHFPTLVSHNGDLVTLDDNDRFCLVRAETCERMMDTAILRFFSETKRMISLFSVGDFLIQTPSDVHVVTVIDFTNDFSEFIDFVFGTGFSYMGVTGQSVSIARIYGATVENRNCLLIYINEHQESALDAVLVMQRQHATQRVFVCDSSVSRASRRLGNVSQAKIMIKSVSNVPDKSVITVPTKREEWARAARKTKGKDAPAVKLSDHIFDYVNAGSKMKPSDALVFATELIARTNTLETFRKDIPLETIKKFIQS